MSEARDTLVLKFGGTSLESPARQVAAAQRVKAVREGGRRVVVVVSARGHTTDHILEDLWRLAGHEPSGREADRALATGEDLSAALLAATLEALQVPARSLRGGEAGIEAEGRFSQGRVTSVAPQRLLSLLDRGVVPVVSGFQASRRDGETITLGRGGSDTSAVALAAALGASCDIVTDVDAVYDRDPNADETARPFDELTHDELVELAERGAQVMHVAAARYAALHEVPLHVYSFRAPLSGSGFGTRIVAGSPERLRAGERS